MKILATLLATIACALPAAAQYDETAKSFHLLPHLADGGGWQSVLLVTNVSQSASHCTFNVYGVPLNRFREFSGATAAAGVRTSSAALSGLTSALPSTTAGQAESAEIREALERLREVGVRLEVSVR